MSAEMVLYLISVVAKFHALIVGLMLLSAACGVISGFIIVVNCKPFSEEERNKFAILQKNCIKYMKIFFIGSIITSIFATVIPGERTLYMMLAAHVLEKSDLPRKVEMVINNKLDEYLAEDKKDAANK